jgi:hypothetical protein
MGKGKKGSKQRKSGNSKAAHPPAKNVADKDVSLAIKIISPK